jgi:hypothetical protein
VGMFLGVVATDHAMAINDLPFVPAV